MIDLIVARWAEAQPEAIAIVDASRETTWAELCAEIDRLRAFVRSASVDCAVVVTPLIAPAIALAAACAAERVDVVLLSHLDVAEATATMEHLGAGCVFAFEGDQPIVAARRSGAPDAATRSESRVYIRTSGTTGRPKTAEHTWATLSAAVRVRPALVGRRWLLGLPYSNMGGLAVLTNALWNGGALVLPADFSPAAALRALTACRVDYVGCTPTFARQMLILGRPEDWASAAVRRITLGGEIVDQALLDGLRTALPRAVIAHHYGSSELGMLITVDDGLAGFPATLLDGERFRVVDGELQARKPETAMLAGASDASGEWLGTHDDVDVVGDRAYFRGRRGEEINVGGFKVNPLPLEEAIRTITGVGDARVVGHKSALVGNLVKAVVWLREGVEQDRVRAEIEALCRARFPEHACPRLFEFPDEMTLSSSQKLSWRSK